VLDQEHDIEGHGDDREAELGDVEGAAEDVEVAVLLEGLEGDLEERETAPGEVEDDVQDGPPLGRLPLVVPPHLRDVLDQRDEHLDVPEHLGRGGVLRDSFVVGKEYIHY